MKVSEWIRHHPGRVLTVSPHASLGEAMDEMLAQPHLRDIYVMAEDGRLLGHVSHKKIALHILAEHRPIHTRRQLMERIVGGTVGDFMDIHFTYAHPDEELDNVLHRQLEHDVEDMPVIDSEERLLGAVNLSAVLRETRRRNEQSGK
jgi:CBS domain-containing protein